MTNEKKLSYLTKLCVTHYTDNNINSIWFFGRITAKIRNKIKLNLFEKWYSKQLISAIKTLSLNAPIMLYRGLCLSVQDLEAYGLLKNGKLQKNVEFNFNGFNSTSKNIELALDFARKNASKYKKIPCVFILNFDCCKGADIKKYSKFPFEEEILNYSLHLNCYNFEIKEKVIYFYCNAYNL